MTPEIRRPEVLPQNKIGQAIQGYIDSDEFSHHARTRNTQSAYKYDLSQFNEYCQILEIDSLGTLNSDQVSNWFKIMQINGFSFTTIARRRSSLVGFLDWAEKKGLLDEDFSQVTALKSKEGKALNKRSINTLNREQLDLLLDAAKRQPSLRDAAFISIAVQTGAKLEQIIDLDCRDIVNLDNGQVGIRFYNKAVDEYDVKPLDEETRNIITGYLINENTDPDNPLFPGWRNNERLTRQGFWFVLKKYKSITGISNLTPTMFRNTYFENRTERRQETATQ